MKRKIKIIISVLLSAMLLVACEEVYDPGEIGNSTDMIVVEGAISDNGGPTNISITFANAYGIKYNNTVRGVANATVTLFEKETGKSEKLINNLEGKYATTGKNIVGIPGHSYKLYFIIGNK